MVGGFEEHKSEAKGQGQGGEIFDYKAETKNMLLLENAKYQEIEMQAQSIEYWIDEI